MKMKNLVRVVALTLSKLPVQIAVAGVLFAATCGYHYGRAFPGGTSFDTKSTATLLGSIATITALVATVSFAYVVFTLNQTNARRHDLIYRFRNALFELDKFLKDYSIDDDIINEALALSYDLKGLKADDFPFRDWEQRVSPWVDSLNEWNRQKEESGSLVPPDATNKDPHLPNRLLGFLSYIESIASDIGVVSIHQIIAGRFIELVTKALMTLASLLIVITIAYETTISWVKPAIAATPVLFVAAAVLMLIEMAYFLYREGKESISFTVPDDEQEADLEAK